jgi:hypothetical protein
VIKRVVLSTEAQADLAGLDRSVALRVVAATDRFAATGAGNVQCLRSIHHASSVFVSAIGASVFTTTVSGSIFYASVIAGTLTAE